jgi:imidazolonepropionase
MRLLVKNIGSLVQARSENKIKVSGKEMASLAIIENAWLFIQGDRIVSFGSGEDFPDNADRIVDAEQGYVFPVWCDSHTHIVYAGSRETEFVDRLKGLTYEEIAERGGGILNSAGKLQKTTEDDLFDSALARLNSMVKMGTGAVEIKSGYGLTVEDELKMLRVIRRLKESSQVLIRSTFLGAHAIPSEYKENRKGYIQLITEKMIPQIAEEGLADYCDVFCDRGFFTPAETDEILKTGLKYGLRPKIHANELDFSGGIQVGVANNALSVDHLECTGDEEIALLLDSGTMPTLLPSTAFFIGLPYPPARKMIDSGLPVALATDFNPGSSPSGKISFSISLACIQMKMTPEEAINAATINGAFAMGIENEMGTITPGKRASFFITHPMPSLGYLPYSFGSDLIKTTFLNGIEII